MMEQKENHLAESSSTPNHHDVGHVKARERRAEKTARELNSISPSSRIFAVDDTKLIGALFIRLSSLACNFYGFRLNYGLWFLTFETRLVSAVLGGEFFSSAVTVKWRNRNSKNRLQRLHDRRRQIKTSACHFRHNFIADNYVDGFLKLFTILLCPLAPTIHCAARRKRERKTIFGGGRLTGLHFCQHLLEANSECVWKSFHDAAFCPPSPPKP